MKETPRKIIICCTSPYAKLMHHFFSTDTDMEVVAFTVDQDYITDETFCGLPVLPFETIEQSMPTENHGMFVAMGYRSMRNRKVMYDRAKKKGYTLVNFIHSQAVVSSDLKIGDNNAILQNCSIEPFTEFGSNNVIWSSTTVGNNSSIGDHNYVSGYCALASELGIGDLCFIAIASAVIDGLTLCDETQLVPGSIVYKDTLVPGIYKGNPAKLLKKLGDKGIRIRR